MKTIRLKCLRDLYNQADVMFDSNALPSFTKGKAYEYKGEGLSQDTTLINDKGEEHELGDWVHYFHIEACVDFTQDDLLNEELSRLKEVVFSDAFPSNPRPFLRALEQGVNLYGNDFLHSNDGRVLMWAIMAMAYGQTAQITVGDEFLKLYYTWKQSQS